MIDFRPMRYEDLEALNSIRNLSREWLHDPREFTLKETQEWWMSNEENGEGPCYWIIIDYDKDKYIGYFRTDAYDLWNVEGEPNEWLIGGDLHPDYRGKGIMSDLYPKFMMMLIRAFDARFFYLKVLKHNLRAGRLYTKLGFEQLSESERDIEMCMTADRVMELYGE